MWSAPLLFSVQNLASVKLPALINFLVDTNVCDEASNNQNNAAPSVPVLVSKVSHKWNYGTEHKRKCTNHDKDNTEILHCIVIFSLCSFLLWLQSKWFFGKQRNKSLRILISRPFFLAFQSQKKLFSSKKYIFFMFPFSQFTLFAYLCTAFCETSRKCRIKTIY